MGIIYSITNMPGPSKKQERKDKVWENTQTCCAKYSKCMFVNVDNVTSKQICIMRKQFREIDAVMCMGKNTLMRKAIKEMQDADIEENKSRPHLNIIRNALVLNTGCIFTNGDLSVISKILDTQVRSAPGQAALLEKLKVRPFEYKMNILNILDNGEVYPASVLKIAHDSILACFKEASDNVAAVSLAIGMPNAASIHHVVLNAFKNLACASIASGFGFKEADKLASAAASAPAQASSAPATAAPAKAAEKVKEEEPEEDLDMGDLFGY